MAAVTTLKLTTVATAENPIVGDLYLDPATGSYVVIGDTADTFAEAVAQGIRNRILFFKGEWFLDTREGVPWIQRILGHSPDLGAVRSILRNVIEGTEGVAGVTSIDLELDHSNRKLAVAFVADLEDGTTLDSSDTPTPFIVSL